MRNSPESKWDPCWLTPGRLSEAARDPAAPGILPYASTREARRGGEAGVGRSGGERGGGSCLLVPGWVNGWETLGLLQATRDAHRARGREGSLKAELKSFVHLSC